MITGWRQRQDRAVQSPLTKGRVGMAGRIEIRGYGGENVPNEFLRQPSGSSSLGVILPGVGYTSAMPLLYYAGRLLIERGCDVLIVNYDYRSISRTVPRQELEERLFMDTLQALSVAYGQHPYASVVLVGKSLGTMAMAHLLESRRWPIEASVWLTPIVRREDVRRELEKMSHRAFVAIGTDDGEYDEQLLDELEQRHGVDVCTIESAEHSIDIDGDVPGSVEAVRTVMHRMQAFFERIDPAP